MSIQWNNELYHYGIPRRSGRYKWGSGKNPRAAKKYRSSSIRGAMAARANKKVDNSFNKWNENTKKKQSAIDLGKKRNELKISYETNKQDKNLKKEYRTTNRQYKKALRKNTLYRQGSIREEVGRDLSKKYLKVAKATDSRKMYDRYNRERNKARRAQGVGAKRSQRKANFKRNMTKSAKAAVGAAAAYAGARYAQKKYNVRIDSEQFMRAAKNARKFYSYIY